MVVALVGKVLTKIFGSRNDRLIKGYFRRVEAVNALQEQTRQLSDQQLKDQTKVLTERLQNAETMEDLAPQALAVAREAMDRSVGIRNIFNPEHSFDPQQLSAEGRQRYQAVAEKIQTVEPLPVTGSEEPLPTWHQVDIPVELYEEVRQLYPQSRPPFRARPFDVQLIGGMVLSEGNISEMKTGEGKTIVAPLACYLACLEDLQCYVVTVNDYLVQRDRDWVFPFYYHLGLTVGAIHPFHMQPPGKKAGFYREICGLMLRYRTTSVYGPRLGELSDWT